MKKQIWMAVVAFGAITLGGCSSEQAPEANADTLPQVSVPTPETFAAPASKVASLEPMKIYLYSSTSDEVEQNSCFETVTPGFVEEDLRCTDEKNWQALCENTDTLSKEAAKFLVAGIAFDEGEDIYNSVNNLIDNNHYSQNIYFEQDGSESCKIDMTVRGYYDGNSINRTFSGYAIYILLGSDRKSYIVDASKDNNF